jgi:hypothetical protein
MRKSIKLISKNINEIFSFYKGNNFRYDYASPVGPAHSLLSITSQPKL